MSESRKKTRLSPPLMFAFRDAHRARDAKTTLDQRDRNGERVVAARKSLRASVTEVQLRSELARDLDTLMNTTNLGGTQDLGDYPEVARSIVNFGLPDIVHRSLDEEKNTNIVDEIKTAIFNFEPRLVRSTVRVARDGRVDQAYMNIRFLVSGEMSCDPVAVPVEFVADLEVSTGHLGIMRR